MSRVVIREVARPRHGLRFTSDGIRRRFQQRDDSGQTIVIVVVLLVLLATLAPFMAGQVTRDDPLLISSSNKHAALAAAEAGLQWYRDNLDSYPSYWVYSSSNNPLNDAALSGYCGAGQSQTCDLAGTSPPEAFHYAASFSNLFTQTGGAAGTVQLTVTGRAGTRGNYAFVRAQASFSTSSVLNDAYYSNIEVLDPNSQTIQGYNVTLTPPGGNSTSQGETNKDISYTYSNGSTNVTVSNVSVWTAVCNYDTYSPNYFIDTLGLTINGQQYSVTHPYYGPYMGSNNFTFSINSQNTVVSSGPTTITVQVPQLACESPYDFVSTETFNGPVYTNDQLHICGSPTFNGSPDSLTSGVPSDVPYLWNVPGSVQIGTRILSPGLHERHCQLSEQRQSGFRALRRTERLPDPAPR